MFGPLTELRERPIPDLAEARRAKENYRAWPLAVSERSDEALRDVADAGIHGVNHYASSCNPPYWMRVAGAVETIWVREGVLTRLCAVERRLRDQGLRLHLFDGWRPRAVQAFFHNEWTPAALRQRRPDLEGPALKAEVEKYWAAPTEDPASPAPHETGGAVDLTIRVDGGDPLWMGSLFDEATPLAHTDRFERAQAEHLSFSDAEAQANRRLLYWLMREAGFASHPDEWWHFSFGDQMWAALTGADAAFYGLAAPEPPL